MKAEHELINQAFGNESFKQQTLEHALGYLRGRARHRRIMLTSAALGPLMLAFFLMLPNQREQLELRASMPLLSVPVPAKPAQNEHALVVPGTSIRVLSDEELMQMIPDRAVAIVGTGEDRQIVFLDTQRQSTKHGS